MTDQVEDSNSTTPDDFIKSFGEPLDHVLDVDTWTSGQDLQELMGRLQQEVSAAVQMEEEARSRIRANLLTKLESRLGAPQSAGIWQAKLSDIDLIHRGLLFPGRVQACDGTTVTHDTLPLTVTQIGVSLVNYSGDSGSWSQRLYRRDLRRRTGDLEEEVRMLLENRQTRTSVGYDDNDDLSQLAKRAVMGFAERSILFRKATADWRIGHGSPLPVDILWGAGSLYKQLLPASRDLAREMVDFKKFVFVPSAPSDRVLLTIGNALNPLEFAIVDYLTSYLRTIIGKGRYDKNEQQKMRDFAEEIGPHFVVGVYRASLLSPSCAFYAHRDYALDAARLVIADSVLQEHRGFPMLIDLADRACQVNFGTSDFISAVRLAYTNSGQPWRYLGERETRKG